MDDREHQEIIERQKLYKQYIKNERKEGYYGKRLNLTKNIATEISNGKRNYFDNLAEKLCDTELNWKVYCSNFKSSTNWKKVPIHTSSAHK